MALSFDAYLHANEGRFVEEAPFIPGPQFPIGNYDMGDCAKCGEEVFVDQIILKKREYMTFSYDVDLPPMHVPKPYKSPCSQGKPPIAPYGRGFAPRPIPAVPYGYGQPHGVEGAVAFKRF